MLEKFPQKIIGKWNRFNSLEKGFILYCLILSLLIFFNPIINITPISGSDTQAFFFLNKYMIGIDIIIIGLLLILILRNLSFRFKSFINIFIGFKDNDALLNFIILFLISSIFLSVSSIVQLLKYNFSNSINLSNQYYLIGICLIIGIIRNLLLALNLSKSKRKGQIININNHKSQNQDEKDKIIKTLFD